METLGKDCDDCGIPLVAERTWRALPREVRKTARERLNIACHVSHDVCARCHARRRPKPPPRPNLRAEQQAVADELLAADWSHLADVCKSDWHNAEDLAMRLGYTTYGLVKAVERLRGLGLLPAPVFRRSVLDDWCAA